MTVFCFLFLSRPPVVAFTYTVFTCRTRCFTTVLKSSSSELKDEKVAVAKEKMTQVGNRALEEGRDLFSVTARAIDLSFKQDINPEDIVLVCDEIDKVAAKQSSDKSFPDVSIDRKSTV